MTTVSNQNQVSSSLLNTMNGTSSSSSSSSSTSSSTTGTTSASDLTQEFMTLLVAQMQNQDPMNPMDNSQVTSQLAQLNTVTGINNLNTTLNGLMSNYQANQTYQASSLIGHNVLAAGNNISTTGSGGYFGVQLPSGADSLQVNILDSSGNTVRTLNYGSQQSGSPMFQWDGYENDGTVAPSGNYTFNVTAKLAGTTTPSTALGVASVSSVSNNSGTISLNLSNNSSIPTSSVVQVF